MGFGPRSDLAPYSLRLAHERPIVQLQAVQQWRSIQVLRAVAALGVVEAHFSGFHGSAPLSGVREGVYGVDLFFVISGFLMAKIVATGPTPAHFAFRRFARIVPFYWLLNLVWIIHYWPGSLAPGKLVLDFTFWPIMDGPDRQPINYPGWSLTFEVLFYAVVTLSLIWRRWAWIIAGTLWALSFIVALTTQNGPAPVLGNPLFLEFLIGVWIARMRPRSAPFGLAAVVAGGLMLLAPGALHIDWAFTVEHVYDVRFTFIRALLVGPAVGLIFWGAVQLERYFGRAWDVLVKIGDASLSIYLTQALILIYAWDAGAASGIPPMLFLPAGVLVCAAVGLLTHVAIERPLLKWLHAVRRPVPALA